MSRIPVLVRSRRHLRLKPLNPEIARSLRRPGVRSSVTSTSIGVTSVTGLDVTPARHQDALSWQARREGAPIDRLRVEGYVDGEFCVATWKDGVLDATPELVRRAEIAVSLGERWSRSLSDGNGKIEVVATLDGPMLAVAFTLMQAFSSVTAVSIPSNQG